jgi:hypothetical protein
MARFQKHEREREREKGSVGEVSISKTKAVNLSKRVSREW